MSTSYYRHVTARQLALCLSAARAAIRAQEAERAAVQPPTPWRCAACGGSTHAPAVGAATICMYCAAKG